MAGLRACKCLPSFYRTDLFGECKSCGDNGLECADDFATLKSGFWWDWKNETHKNLYKKFTSKVLNVTAEVNKHMDGSLPNRSSTKYPHPVPTPHRCPRQESCTGGFDSKCSIGYKGPLCEVCSDGYYKLLKTCKLCPTKTWMVGQLSILAAIIVILFAMLVWSSKKKSKKNLGRSSVDIVLGQLKIVIGFYQVTFGLLEALAYIEWPDSLALIGKYSQMLQLNVFQIAPVHCLFPEFKIDAFGDLFAILTMNAAVIILSFFVYGIRKLYLLRSTLDDQQKALKMSQTKEVIYRNAFFILYVTYLSTCSKTAAVLPPASRTLCSDDEKDYCTTYLKADFSINCASSRYKRLVKVGYVAVGYVLLLPAASFLTLMRKRKELRSIENDDEGESCDDGNKAQSTELLMGLRFLFENYRPSAWYWELVDVVRKIVLTSGLILIGRESRSYAGIACIISGVYAVAFAVKKPVVDPFENRLMLTSLVVTLVNLGIGAVSRIPQENIPVSVDGFLDNIVFEILVVGANALVIVLLIGKNTFSCKQA